MEYLIALSIIGFYVVILCSFASTETIFDADNNKKQALKEEPLIEKKPIIEVGCCYQIPVVFDTDTGEVFLKNSGVYSLTQLSMCKCLQKTTAYFYCFFELYDRFCFDVYDENGKFITIKNFYVLKSDKFNHVLFVDSKIEWTPNEKL